MTTVGTFKIIVSDEAQLISILTEAASSISRRQQILNLSRKDNLAINNDVEFSRISENEAELRVKISDSLLMGNDGSIVWLFGLLFGSTFRHDSIREFRLTKIDFSPAMYYNYKGPAYGISKMKEEFNMEFPIISCPLPSSISLDSWKSIVKILVSSHVRFIVESPIEYPPNRNTFEHRIKFLDNVAKQQKTTVIYFVNMTGRYEEIKRWIEDIPIVDSTNNIKIGLRFCPLSTGLGILPGLRNFGYPIMTYTLLDRIYCENRNFGMSGSCLASTLRLLGADVVNAGLLVSRAIKNFHAYEVIQELKRNIKFEKISIQGSLPILTGGVKPWSIPELGKLFGNDVSYHAGMGILKGYPNLKSVKQNCLAYYEATILAEEKINPETVLENNERRFRNYISYALEEKKGGN